MLLSLSLSPLSLSLSLSLLSSNVSGKLTDSLKFKLKDQGHTIGIISVPISSLTRRKHDQWIPFQPYKKDRSYHGDLCLSCYVSEVRIASDLSPTNSHSSSEDVSGSGKKSGGIGAHFEKWSPLGGKLGIGNRLSSSSDSDIRKDLYGGGHLSPIDDERMSSPLGIKLPLSLSPSLPLSPPFLFSICPPPLSPSLSPFLSPSLSLSLPLSLPFSPPLSLSFSFVVYSFHNFHFPLIVLIFHILPPFPHRLS